MEIQTYMKDGMIDNWELFEQVLDYTYAKVTTSKEKKGIYERFLRYFDFSPLGHPI